MATTREYTDYLNDQVDIAPANSQEEYQAAELIEDLFVQHGLETQIQEFDAPTASGMSSRLYLITLFLGVLLAGFIGTPVSIVGLVLVVISFILLALAKNGTDLFASAGPRARSQNVIGVHRATGPNVIKGNRPIVIIAHYDTPRENYLYSAQLAKWNPLIKRLSWPLSIAVAVLACMQVIPFVPLPARHVFWVLGVLAALPLLLLGSAAVYERFANCTTGANDNKASVAAMLGVLDMVRPGPDDAKAWAETHPRGVRHEVEDEVVIEDDPYNPEAWDEDELDEEGLDEEFDDESQEPAGEQSYEDEDYEEEYAAEEEYVAAEEKPSFAARIPFFGRRHEAEEPEPEPEQDEYGLQSPSTIRRGASVLESLQVLPETCVIEYENLAPRAEVIERIESAAFAAPSDGGAYEPEPGEGFGDYGSARGGISGFLASIREFFAGIVARFKGGKFPQIERGETQQFYNSDENDQYEEAEGSADFDATDEGEFVGKNYVDQYDEDEFEDDYDYDDDYDDEYVDGEFGDESEAEELGETYDDEVSEVEARSQETFVPEPEEIIDVPQPAEVVEPVEPIATVTASEPIAEPQVAEPQPVSRNEDEERLEYEESADLWVPEFVDDEDDDDLIADQDALEGTASIPKQELVGRTIDADLGIANDYDESFGLADEGSEPVEASEAQHNIYVPQDSYVSEDEVEKKAVHVRPSFIPEDAEFELLDDDEPVMDDFYDEGVTVEVVDVPSMNDSFEIPELASVEEVIDEGEPEPVEPGAPMWADEPEVPVLATETTESAESAETVEPAETIEETAEVAEAAEAVEETDEAVEPIAYAEASAVETFDEPEATVDDLSQVAASETVEVVDQAAYADAPAIEMIDETDELAADTVDEIDIEEVEPVEEPTIASVIVDEPAYDEPATESVEEQVVAETTEEPAGADETADADVPTEEPVATEEQVEEAIETPADEILAETEEPASVETTADEDEGRLWTPSSPIFDDDLDEPEGFGVESETTLAFKKLTGEELEAHKAQMKSAQEQAASILHEMFETAPERERVTPPRATDVLHEMFATMPYIERMPMEEPAAPVVEAAGEVTDKQLPIEQVVEPAGEQPIEQTFETIDSQIVEPTEEEPIAPEAVAMDEQEFVADEPAAEDEMELEAAEVSPVEDEIAEAVETAAVEEPVAEPAATGLGVEEPQTYDAYEPEPVVEDEPETIAADAVTQEARDTVDEVISAPVEAVEVEPDLAAHEGDELTQQESEETEVAETAIEDLEHDAVSEPVAEAVEAMANLPIEEASYVSEDEIVFGDTSEQDEEEAVASLWDAPVKEVVSVPEPLPVEEAIAPPVPLVEIGDEIDEIDELVDEIPAAETAIEEQPVVDVSAEPAIETTDEIVDMPQAALDPEPTGVIEMAPALEPEAQYESEIEPTAEEQEPAATTAADLEPEAATIAEPEPVVPDEPKPVAEELASEPEPEVLDEPEPVSEEPEPEPAPEPEPEPELTTMDDKPEAQIMSGLIFSSEEDVSEDELEDKDITGLTTFSAEAEADAEDSIPAVVESIPKPRAVDDPDWGKSSFKPSVMSAGRRAMLLDLPDPSVMAVDPLSKEFVEDGADDGQPSKVNDEAMRRFEVLRSVPSPLDEPKTTAEAKTEPDVPAPKAKPEPEEPPMPKYNKNIGSRTPKKNHKRKIRFGRRRKEEEQPVESMGEWLGLEEDYDAKKDGRQIGSWDHFGDDDDKKWKGGATLRAGLRDEDDPDEEYREPSVGLPNFDSLDLMPNDEPGSEPELDPEQVSDEEVSEESSEVMDPETMEELREAVLRLGDDDLISHDIWFVGVGASSLDHAGIKAFLDEHRRDIRGAFLVNLDSIGAGDLTLLTNEGMGRKRRADRRMGRMITNIADALHIDLGHADYSWDETDATPAMQMSVRVGTLMGVSEDGLPANSHTADDEPEYLNDQQIANVADIIAELIRHS